MDLTLLALTFLFWGSILLIGHTYAVYPVLLKWLGRGKSLPEKRFENDDEFPEVAVLMAVYNEEAVLERTLETMLASRYPAGKLRVFVGSDGSTDTSHEIIERFRKHHPELSLRIFPGRNGKIRIINQLAEDADGSDVLVLCDANVAWSPDLLRNLVRHFARTDIGLVGANVQDSVREHSGIGDEEEAYIGQENRTKFLEGVLWGNTMGAFGACYAMRADLFEPVPANFIVDDFYLTMKVIEADRKAIVDLDAVCYEAVSTEISEEFRRKKRIATGNFQNMRHFRKLYRPWSGGWANWFAFWSHKGLRWIGPVLLIVAMLSSSLLALSSPIYLIAVAGFAGSIAVSMIDAAQAESGRHVKLFRFIRYFYSMNVALLQGLVAYAKGVRNSVWEPTKRVLTEPRSAAE